MKAATEANIAASPAFMQLEKDMRRVLEKAAQALVAEGFDPAFVHHHAIGHAIIVHAQATLAFWPQLTPEQCIHSFASLAGKSMNIAVLQRTEQARAVRQ